MIDVYYQIIMRRVAPVLPIKGSEERFLLTIASFDNPFGTLAIGMSKPHHSCDAIRQRRNDLNVQRRSNARKEKLSSTSENHNVVRRREFGDRGAHHLVVNFSIFFEPGELFR